MLYQQPRDEGPRPVYGLSHSVRTSNNWYVPPSRAPSSIPPFIRWSLIPPLLPPSFLHPSSLSFLIPFVPHSSLATSLIPPSLTHPATPRPLSPDPHIAILTSDSNSFLPSELWLSSRGSVCPITGSPLRSQDLVSDDDLKNR